MFMPRLLVIALFSALTACSQTVADKPTSADFSLGEKLERLKQKDIQEASGLAASITNPNMLWTHNDSGNPAEIFLLDKKLNIKLKVKFPKITNRDWEDITVGPGPDPKKNYIYIGEIGDNFAQYPDKKIYRLEEPKLVKDSTIRIDSVDVITVQLPKTRKDTETLMIDPKTKDLFIVSKRENPVVVYKIPYPQSIDSTVVADSVATIPFAQICGGDISADGQEILLKNYVNIFYWKLNKDESIEDAFKRMPTILPYKEEPQGESVAFARDGSGYFTISEMVKDEKTYLMFYKRKSK
jgi:hypothetical protein